jgi:glutamyl/glutaminyl-tRNA synthetase
MRPLFQSSIPDETIKALIPLVKERITKVRDVVGLTKFIFESPVVDKTQINRDFTFKAFEALKASDWTKEAIETNLMETANSNSFHRGEFFMNLRFVVSGQKVTPPLTECMLIIGKEKVLDRLQCVLK